MSFFIKDKEAQAQANNYAVLGFFKKSKNQLIAFILFISALSLLMINILVGELNQGGEPTQNFEILIGIGAYLILALFISFNQRWAIICFGLIYLADKILLITASVGFPISQIIFGVIAVSLSYNAFKVASHLKKIKKLKAE